MGHVCDVSVCLFDCLCLILLEYINEIQCQSSLNIYIFRFCLFYEKYSST